MAQGAEHHMYTSLSSVRCCHRSNRETHYLLDLLHTCYLGVLNVWCKVVVWYMMEAGVWGRLETAAQGLRSDLFFWYSQLTRRMPGQHITRFSDIKASMFGTSADPKCKAKGAEAWGFILILLDMLQTYQGRLDTDAGVYRESGNLLADYIRCLKASPRVLQPSVIQRITDLWKRHMVLMTPLGVFAPKHHLMYHVNYRSSDLGHTRRSKTRA